MSLDDIVQAPPKSAWRKWFEMFLYSVMISATTIALLLAVASIYDYCCKNVPIKVIQLDKPPEFPLCPGTRMDASNMITVERPTILHIVISVMNETKDYNVPNTNHALEPRPHPRPAVFQQDIPWVVPNLPPGKYNRTITMSGNDSDEHPLFVFQEFEVGENC